MVFNLFGKKNTFKTDPSKTKRVYDKYSVCRLQIRIDKLYFASKLKTQTAQYTFVPLVEAPLVFCRYPIYSFSLERRNLLLANNNISYKTIIIVKNYYEIITDKLLQDAVSVINSIKSKSSGF